MKKHLKVVFKIPKKRIKNANTPMNHIVSATKTAWIRENTLNDWINAIKEQFNITAIEPELPNESLEELSHENQMIVQKIKELETDILNLNKKIKDNKDTEYKSLIRKRGNERRKKNKNQQEIDTLNTLISKYEEKEQLLREEVAKKKQRLKNLKDKQLPAIKKEERKVNRNNNKKILEEKMRVNKFQRIFQECFVIVKVHNITNRNFDAPNFYPTVKGIIDAGTDTGILWDDDNNEIIKTMIFLPGKNIDRENYIFEINIFSDIDDVSKALKGEVNE